jgi:hypothetical protein
VPAWFRAMIIIVLVSNSATMFNYPPRPWILTCDKSPRSYIYMGLMTKLDWTFFIEHTVYHYIKK